jgi:hypothetical protein
MNTTIGSMVCTDVHSIAIIAMTINIKKIS